MRTVNISLFLPTCPKRDGYKDYHNIGYPNLLLTWPLRTEKRVRKMCRKRVNNDEYTLYILLSNLLQLLNLNLNSIL